MNLLSIINEIEKVDPEITDRLNSRRAALKDIVVLGSKVASGMLPLLLSSLLNRAYAQSIPQTVKEILSYALMLEYLQADFYTQGIAASGLIPSGVPLTAIQTIQVHENKHVEFLKTILGQDAEPKPSFDYTAHGLFPSVFGDYDTFLTVAMAIEDAAVRAYKGQLENVRADKILLTAALNMHSVEARHASHIRQMRRERGGIAANQKPWISGSNDTGVIALNSLYAGEENKVQLGVDITQLNGIANKVSLNTATEAFDEPLTSTEILAILQPFLV